MEPRRIEAKRTGPRPARSAATNVSAVVFGLFAAIVLAIGWFGDPEVGEPRITIALPDLLAVTTAVPQVPVSTDSTLPPGLGSGPVTQAVYAGDALLADPELIENTPEGPLPKIAADGRRPMQVYAGVSPSTKRPRIAIILTGLGLSADETAAALSHLPVGVTVGFVPYAGDVQRWVAQARLQGREVFLELPVETFGGSGSDSQIPRTGEGAAPNPDNIDWALSRFTGYTGVTNLGTASPVPADREVLLPVMRDLARRGLIFFDGGPVSPSVTAAAAKEMGTVFAHADATIDSNQASAEIDRKLSELESMAKAKGVAVGVGYIYPATIDRVARWTRGLSERGFALMPVSAIVDVPNK